MQRKRNLIKNVKKNKITIFLFCVKNKNTYTNKIIFVRNLKLRYIS